MEWIELGELSQIELGKTPSRSNPKYWNGNHTWVSIADINNKHISNSKEGITKFAIEATNIKEVPKNTVIMSFKLSIGKRAITKEKIYTNEAIAAFHIKDKSMLNTEYLYYSLGFINLLETTDKSVKGKTLNKGKLQLLKIPVPAIEIQKQIVELLDEAQSLIDNRKEQIELLDDLIESIFYDMFGNPVVNDKGWEVKKFAEFSNVRSSKRVFISECVEIGIPFYRGTEIAKLSLGEETIPKLYITEEHYETLKKATGTPKIGDLLLPSICAKGEVWRVDNKEPFYFKDGRVLWVELESEFINSIYLQYSFSKTLIRDFNGIASGSTFPEMKIFILKDLEIIIPPLLLQNEFAEKVQAIESQKELMKRSLELMEDNYNNLMQRAFKGELF